MAFDIQVFNTQTYTAYTEELDQQVELFNEATGGAIILTPSDGNQGDFSVKASFKKISGLVRRRAVHAGDNAIVQKRLEQLKNQTVKVPSGTPQVIWEAAQYSWVKQNPALAALVLGEQLARDTIGDMLNVAIMGCVAAVSNVSALKHTATAGMTFGELVKGAGKFGDRQSAIACWVMHSKTMTDLYGNAIANNENLFDYGSVNVTRDPFKRLMVMTDSEALINSTDSANTKYLTLGLTQNAVMIEQNNDFNANLETRNGKENIVTSYQAEWSYNLGLAGFTWKGGAAPGNAEIASPTSWQQAASSAKDTAGVLIVSS